MPVAINKKSPRKNMIQSLLSAHLSPHTHALNTHTQRTTHINQYEQFVSVSVYSEGGQRECPRSGRIN